MSFSQRSGDSARKQSSRPNLEFDEDVEAGSVVLVLIRR